MKVIQIMRLRVFGRRSFGDQTLGVEIRDVEPIPLGDVDEVFGAAKRKEIGRKIAMFGVVIVALQFQNDVAVRRIDDDPARTVPLGEVFKLKVLSKFKLTGGIAKPVAGSES